MSNTEQTPVPSTEELQFQIGQLLQMVQQLQSQAATAAAAPAPAITTTSKSLEKVLKKPPEFDGKDKKACQTFISQLNLFMSGNPHLFSDDRTKVTFAASYLRGEAYAWFEPHLLDPNDELLRDYALFTAELLRNKGDPDRSRNTTRQLQSLVQTGSTADYSSRFYQLSAYLSWNDDALRDQFYTGLKKDVKDALAFVDRDPATLKQLSDLAIRLDNRIHERRIEDRRSSGSQLSRTFAPRLPSAPVPMDLDATRSGKFKPLTPQERQRRLENQLCLYCGEPGHRAGQCPAKARPRARIQATLDSASIIDLDETKNE